ncbi:unnamed protein product [Effrenium voratum]|nr:unnamed protein product [Effrenium voratum]
MTNEDSDSPTLASERLGHWIISLDGKSSSWVISETKKFWKLRDGKVVQKASLGKKWQWSDRPPQSVSPSSAPSACPSPELSFQLPPSYSGKARLGVIIRGMGGASWGRAVAEEPSCWHLDTGHMAKKCAENLLWRWDDALELELELAGLPDDEAASLWEGLPQAMLLHCCGYLSLRSALPVAATCRRYTEHLAKAVPVELPPPQVDALLEFCLLQVLLGFDEERLPLPVTAIYAEMRGAAKRAVVNAEARLRLESTVLQAVGRSCKAQQKDLLDGFADGRSHPHHVSWMPDVKSSCHRSLERMAKHFHSTNLIEVTKQRWHKRIHHSPNTRTCTELLLIGVNRTHPLFQEHEAWALHTEPGTRREPGASAQVQSSLTGCIGGAAANLERRETDASVEGSAKHH